MVNQMACAKDLEHLHNIPCSTVSTLYNVVDDERFNIVSDQIKSTIVTFLCNSDE